MYTKNLLKRFVVYNEMTPVIFFNTISLIVGAVAEVSEIVESNDNNNWWTNAIFYHINVETFMDTDGDGIGDLKGITSKLSYLSTIGVTAIWLSSVLNSPIVDFKIINEEYGTMEDFVELLHETENLDIRIVMDLTLSHTSNRCDWFTKSSQRTKGYEDFYVWANRKPQMMRPYNYSSMNLVLNDSSWTWHQMRKQYYFHRFSAQEPNLNVRDLNLVQTIDNVMLYWLSKNISGFRIDGISSLLKFPNGEQSNHMYDQTITNFELLCHWRSLLDNYTTKFHGPARIIMVSDDIDFKIFMDYYESVHGVVRAHIPLNFLLITDLNEKSDARDFVFTIQKWLTYMPSRQTPNWIMCNYDHFHLNAMNMLLASLPGISIIYNGEKCYHKDKQKYTATRNDSKALSAENQCISGQSEDKNYQGLQNTSKSLINLRKLLLVRVGRLQPLIINRWVFAVIRSLGSESSIVTVINAGSLQQEFNLRNHLEDEFTFLSIKILLSSGKSQYEPGSLISFNTNFTLLAKEGIVLQVKLSERVNKKELSAERRALIKLLMKSLNIVLVGMLFYKLWHNKWTKLNFNKENIW